MANYKYLILSSYSDAYDQEIEFQAPNNQAALAIAGDDPEAYQDENGTPVVYRENAATSRWGCGMPNCTACNSWLEINSPLEQLSRSK